MVTEDQGGQLPSFGKLGVGPELQAALAELGYEEPTPVQVASLPPLLEGRDVLAQAATGTGKTAAFALPILQRLRPGSCGPGETSALVLVPTRELAMQVAEAVHNYGRRRGVSVLPIYGGQDIGQQLRRLKRGVDVVVATPGRAIDHLERRTLKLDKVTVAVLDEADEMLDLGFADDLESILGALPDDRQLALFSATLPPRIAAIAERHLRQPVRVRIEPQSATRGSLPTIHQTAYVVPRAHKDVALGRVLDVAAPQSAIIFCRTRVDVDRLTGVLGGHGYEAAALHGGMTQEQRDRVLKRFKAHKLQLLVATDVAARGLDVEKLSHVINFDLPTSAEAYVHRIGRTGRAGREGNAITLLEPREQRYLKNIERLTGQRVEIGQVPTVVDLRAKRMELTRATVEEALGSDKLEGFRSLVEALGSRADLMEVALAAMASLHEALNPGRDQETEIPALQARPVSERRDAPASRREGPTSRREPARGRRERPDDREVRGTGARVESAGGMSRPARRPGATPGVRIFVGLGRSAGLRPADLVGAIANEAGLESAEIGAIQIADHYAFVEVPEARQNQVLAALRKATLRGRKVKVDKDRPGGVRSRRE
jgi:ATP-dependent RNA helicase DeaD